VTARCSASANARATPGMACARAPVSSQIRPRGGEDGRDDPRAIRHRRGLAPPERQCEAASGADGRAGEAEEDALQEDRRPDGDDRPAGPPARLLAAPVLPLLRARGGGLEAHLGGGHLGHVGQGVPPDVPGDRRHGHGGLQVPGGHGQAEGDPPPAADDPSDVGRFEEAAAHHLGAAARKAAARSSSWRTRARTGSPRSRSRPVTVRPTAPS
jgi:hypothetical protein